MAKLSSGRLKNLNIGISSSTENVQVLDVTGNVGIKTSNTQGYELFVNGDANITGIVSASAYFGNGGNLEDIIAEVRLVSVSKLEGFEIKDEGVGIGTTFTAINFIGQNVIAAPNGDTATVTLTDNPIFNNLSVSGISTLGSVKISSGIISATVGVVTYYGDGSKLTGVITSGSGISIQGDGVPLGIATAINFDLGLDVLLSNSGIATVTSSSGSSGISSIQIKYNDINIGTGSSILNFKGSGITSVTSSPIGITTITVDLTGNLDGGVPNSNYGGIETIDAGGV